MRGITRFISSHPDQDHIGGLVRLDDALGIVNFYCVNNSTTKEIETDDFKRYKALRDSEKAFYLFKGCSRRWMNMNDEERGSSGINILWPNTENEHFQAALEAAANGNTPNNIGPIVRYSVQNGPSMLWMGDIDGSFLEKVEDELDIPETTVLFAPHHGRKSGKVPPAILSDMDPKLVVIGQADSVHLDYYAGYNSISQNSAGDITLETSGEDIHIYVSNESYSVDFLSNHGRSNNHGYYIGTLEG